MNSVLEDILHGREQRYAKQIELLSIYPNTLINLSLNIVGSNKLDLKYTKLFYFGIDIVEELCTTNNIVINHIEIDKKNKAGFFACFSVNEDAIIVKKLTIDIEEQKGIYRLLDIDVIDSAKKSISRSDLGMDKRKCFLCGNDTYICRQNNTHTQQELINYTDNLLNSI